MTEKTEEEACCGASTCEPACCKVEAVISVDERGQTVLPKTLREKVGIKPGDKFAVVTMEMGGKVCCISLIRAEDLEGSVKDIIGPMAEELSK